MIKDIRTYMPVNNNTVFCLDTNVLYWYCYPRYNDNLHPQRVSEIGVYYEFVDRLVRNGNPIITSIYNVSEFLNVIEKHECEIYQKLHDDIVVSVKDLRNMQQEREKLKKLMAVSTNNVFETCEIIEFEMKRSVIDKFVDNLHSHKCDVFDYVTLDYYKEHNKLNIVTDDADFMSVDGINIFTSNEQMLNQ